MKKIADFVNRNLNLLEIILICLNLFSGLIISGIANMDQYGSIFNYAQFFLLIVFIIVCVWCNKTNLNFRNPYFILLALFFIFSLITILLNPTKVDNIKIYIITLIQWLLLFLAVKDKKKVMLSVLNILNYFIFLFAIVSLIFFMKNITVIYSLDRYAGIFANPNMGGVIACVSLGFSLILLSNATLKKKIFLLINIFLQILFVRVSLSRSALIMMWTMIIIFTFMCSFLYTKRFSLIVRNILIVSISVLLTYSFLGDSLYNIRSLSIDEQQEQKESGSSTAKDTEIATEGDETTKEKELKEKEQELEENMRNGTRNEEWQKESTSYRLDLLKYGIKTCLDKPLFGQGIRNLPAAVEKVAEKKLSGIVGGGVHNSYLQLFISNGLFGFISFASIHCYLLYSLLKRRKQIFNLNDKEKIVLISGFLALYFGLLVYGLFEAILVMSSTFVTSIFAISAGGLRNE